MRKLTNRRAIKKLYMPHKVLLPIVKSEVVENVEVSEEIEVTEKNFTPIKVGFTYVECEKATLTNLMNRLPADVFLEYLKDRGFKEINF